MSCYLWSGQSINLKKSGVHISKIVPNGKGSEIANLLGIKSAENSLRYLGLPLLFDESKTQVLVEVIGSVKVDSKGRKLKFCLKRREVL